MDADAQPVRDHSFRVGAALVLLEQGELYEKITLRAFWHNGSTACHISEIGLREVEQQKPQQLVSKIQLLPYSVGGSVKSLKPLKL